MSKMVKKIIDISSITKSYKYDHKDGMYTILFISTGLTFGSISALFGLSHGIINQEQYALLFAVAIASAAVPTLIATAFVIPKFFLSSAKHSCHEKE